MFDLQVSSHSAIELPAGTFRFDTNLCRGGGW